jgi:hypothetical protein
VKIQSQKTIVDGNLALRRFEILQLATLVFSFARTGSTTMEHSKFNIRGSSLRASLKTLSKLRL